MIGNSPFVVAVDGSDAGAIIGLQITTSARFPYLVIGVVVLTVTIVDLFWTTLWGDKGAGPLSSWLMRWLWQGIRRLDSGRSWVLSIGGPLILSLNLIVWIGLIWLGWTFIFASGDALIHARRPGSVTWPTRVYFVANAMFTMGNGDVYPGSDIWEVATALTTASGLLSVTLGVTYLLSVLGAIVENRSFATSITGVGKRGEAFVRTGWDGDNFHQFDLVLDTLSLELSRLAVQHKTHPILHYYRSNKEQNSAAIAIAVFDEALTLLRFGIPDEHRPNDALLETARSNAESHLEAFTDTIGPADQAPPPPDLDSLRDAGIPTVSDEEFADALDDLDERRRQLLGVVESSGWSWPPEEH